MGSEVAAYQNSLSNDDSGSSDEDSSSNDDVESLVDDFKDELNDNVKDGIVSVKYDSKQNMIKVKIDERGRHLDTDWETGYYETIRAAQKTKIHKKIPQIQISDLSDQYVYNTSDIQNLSFAKKNVVNYVENNFPSDYSDYKNGESSIEYLEYLYASDALKPVVHKDLSDNDD